MVPAFLISLLLTVSVPQVTEQVTITARDGATAAENQIDIQTIEAYNLTSVQDLFTFFPALFLNTRGVNGIQSDISYRGSRGNQVGVSLNGIPMNNIQSYHHNFDLPVAPEDLARFQVASSGSGVDTPYAFNGQVMLETLDNQQERYHLAWGSNYTYHIYAADRGLSYMLEGSEGYRENTDYHNSNITWQGQLRGGVRVFTAFNVKHFGAEDFYAPYPSYEKTQTYLASASWKGITAYALRHDDTFFLDRTNRESYRNDNTSYRGGIFQEYQKGRLFLSYHAAVNRLESHNLFEPGMEEEEPPHVLDDQEITVKGAWLQQVGNWTLRPGLGISYSSRNTTELLPFVSAYRRFGSLGLVLEASRSVRLPDYTELYYASPTNQGNAELQVEESWNADVMVHWRMLSASVFYRDETNLIDWVRRDEMWHAENIGNASIWGLEFNASYRGFTLGYQMISRDKNLDMETKYTTYTPENRWVLRYSGREGTFVYQYLDIPELGKASVLDVTLFGTGFYVKIQNALDDTYQTLPGIPMPGRTYMVGYRINGPLRW